jgi:hypothetical protein
VLVHAEDGLANAAAQDKGIDRFEVFTKCFPNTAIARILGILTVIPALPVA